MELDYWPELFDAICDEFKNIKKVHLSDITERGLSMDEYFVLEMEHPLIGEYGEYTMAIKQDMDGKGNKIIVITDIIKF